VPAEEEEEARPTPAADVVVVVVVIAVGSTAVLIKCFSKRFFTDETKFGLGSSSLFISFK
jgi:hypothetical protein